MINRKVFLVSGHDIDGDPGALFNVYKESEETMQISKLVADILKQYPIEVIVDPFTNDMYESVKFINARCSGLNDGIVIDVHKNSHTSPAYGIETWIMKNSDAETVSLAKLIQEESIKSTGLRNRGVKNENWYVITNAKCRGALVECGFINGDPNTDEYDYKYAVGIAYGILRFFGIPIAKPAPVVIAPPAPQPAKLSAIDITNKTVVTNKDANLWDLTFTNWANAKSVKVIPAGTQLEVSATVDHPLGSRYYLTEYSYKSGIFNGINVSDVTTHVEPPKPILPPVSTVLNEEVPIVKPEPIVEPKPIETIITKSWLDKVLDALNKLIELFTSLRKK